MVAFGLGYWCRYALLGITSLASNQRAFAAHLDVPIPEHTLSLHRVKVATARNGSHIRPKPRSRMLGQDQRAETTVPLVTGIGTHYAYLWVGTPAQRQSVIIDTGSYRTAFPCDPCRDCGDYLSYHESGPFEPDESSSAVMSNEHWNQHYSEGDGWEALVLEDEAFVGGAELASVPSSKDRSVRLPMGCQNQIGGLFVTQFADGIMGMGMHEESPVPLMVASGVLAKNAFSLCFAGGEGGGGTLALGGASTHLHEAGPASMVFAAMHQASNIFYAVEVLGIYIVPTAGSSSSSSSVVGSATSIGQGSYSSISSAIVDSGTTFTYLPADLKEAFAARWKAVTGKTYDTDGSLDVDVKRLPNLVFELRKAGSKSGSSSGTVLVTVKPDAYVDHYCPQGQYGDACFNYLSVLFEGGTAILGANFMQDHDVLFDNSEESNRRVGFARASCEWSGPIDGPTPAPTATPAPTTTPAPSPAPTTPRPTANSGTGVFGFGGLSADALLLVVAAASLLGAALCFVSLLACKRAVGRFRDDQASSASARQGGAFVGANSQGSEGRLYGQVCGCLVAGLDAGSTAKRRLLLLLARSRCLSRCCCCRCCGGGATRARASSRFAFAALDEEVYLEDGDGDDGDEGDGLPREVARGDGGGGNGSSVSGAVTVELTSRSSGGGGGGFVSGEGSSDRLGGLVTAARDDTDENNTGGGDSSRRNAVQSAETGDRDGETNGASRGTVENSAAETSSPVAITFNPISMLARSGRPSKAGYARPGEGSEF